MSTVRAKFRVHSVGAFTDQTGKPNGYKVSMSPVYSSDPASENARFYSATPWGEIILGTVNPQAAEQFTPGMEFYVDFTPVGTGLETR